MRTSCPKSCAHQADEETLALYCSSVSAPAAAANRRLRQLEKPSCPVPGNDFAVRTSRQFVDECHGDLESAPERFRMKVEGRGKWASESACCMKDGEPGASKNTDCSDTSGDQS